MTQDDELRALLRLALPPVQDRPPSRDLWPEVLSWRTPSSGWSWLDLGVAALIAILLSLYPDSLWLLLLHL